MLSLNEPKASHLLYYCYSMKQLFAVEFLPRDLLLE